MKKKKDKEDLPKNPFMHLADYYDRAIAEMKKEEKIKQKKESKIIKKVDN